MSNSDTIFSLLLATIASSHHLPMDLDINTLTIFLIAIGGIVMLLSIFKYVSLIRSCRDLIAESGTKVCRLHGLNLLLMCFFFIGYLLTLYTLLLQIEFASIFVTAIIFFFGAFFVMLGIILQSDMLTTLRQRHERIVSKNEQLIQTENVTIFALAYQAELRDGETGKHLERTSKYVEILAKEIRQLPQYQDYLSDGYIHDLVKSAPLHDIGKVGVPDSILKKPGRLSSEEFKIIQKHCEYGVEVLYEAEKKLNFKSFFRIAISLILSHHERWDGKGYPHGLKGEEIPLSARIMAVADVYDALRSKRCYKDAFSHEKACAIIQAEKGKQFDPDITEAFLRMEKQFSLTSENLTDNPPNQNNAMRSGHRSRPSNSHLSAIDNTGKIPAGSQPGSASEEKVAAL